jgi:PmbA protein
MCASETPSLEVVELTVVADPQELLGRAEDAVRRLSTLDADCAEVYLSSGSSVNVDIEKDVVTYTTTDSETGHGLRVVREGRLGFAYTSDPRRIEDAGRNALALTQLAPETGYKMPGQTDHYGTVEGLEDPGLLSMEPGEAVEMAGEMVATVREAHPGASVAGGAVSFGHGTVAIANTEGVAIASRGTSMTMWAYVVLRDTDVSTGFEFGSSRSRDVDARWVGTEAARMAIDAQGAVPLEEGGELTVIFRPPALAELLEHTLLPSFIGDAAQRGESAFTGKEGQQVAGPSVSVVDDPVMPGGLASGRADDEGVSSRRNILIEKGVLQGFLYDTFTANQYGVGTTGSASRDGWKSQPEAGVTNILVEAPSLGELEDLVAEVDRGVLVHDLMGAHTSNRSTLDFSVNTTMPFEIRNGEVLGVRNPAMLGGNVGEMLGRVLGAGGAPRQCPSSSNVVIPWMAVEGIMVTP